MSGWCHRKQVVSMCHPYTLHGCTVVFVIAHKSAILSQSSIFNLCIHECRQSTVSIALAVHNSKYDVEYIYRVVPWRIIPASEKMYRAAEACSPLTITSTKYHACAIYTILRFHINDSRYTTGVFLEARSSFKCKLQYLTSEMNTLFLLYELFSWGDLTSKCRLHELSNIRSPGTLHTADIFHKTVLKSQEYCTKSSTKIRLHVLPILQKTIQKTRPYVVQCIARTLSEVPFSRPSVQLMVTHI